jgi:glycosyltransferase involved in cell wall biosynthesis
VGTRCEKSSRFLRPFRFLFDLAKTAMSILDESVELVHVNPSLDFKAVFRDGCTVLLAALARKKVLVYVFGWSLDFEKTLEKYFLPIFRWVFFRANCIVVQSDTYQQVLERWGYQGRIVVETGIVDEALIDGWGEKEITAHVLEPRDHLRVLFLARLEKDKGIFQTLEAFKIFSRGIRHAELIIAGCGSESNHVLERIQNEHIEGVTMAGQLAGSELARAYHEADIYVLPTSHGEGMPSSVLEAMACGLPVVTRPVGGIPNFFIDGVMGYLVKTTEPCEIAGGLERLAANKGQRLHMAIQNHRYAKCRFLAPVVAARIESIYAELG